ncbi:hypothetical protein ACVQZT_002331 [Salmonella enterica subsp. enterica serovar Newport]
MKVIGVPFSEVKAKALNTPEALAAYEKAKQEECSNGADFYSDSKEEGAESRRIFLNECQKDGIDPVISHD